MAAPKRKKSELERQKEIWYKKLADSGFDDIEKGKVRDWLKRDSAYMLKGANWQDKAQYYQMATNFLEDYKFSDEVERVIWDYHSNGIPIRDIASTITKTKVRKINKDQVFYIIKALKHKMFAMYLMPKVEYHE